MTADGMARRRNKNTNVMLIRGFGMLEDIYKLKACDAYESETVEEQNHLLITAVIGHIQKAITCVSEIRGVGLAEAAAIVAGLVPVVCELSPSDTQIGFLFGETPSRRNPA